MKRLLLAILLLLPISASAQFNGCSAGFCAPASSVIVLSNLILPVMNNFSAGIPSNTSAQFTGFQSGGWGSFSSTRDVPVPIGGTVSNLTVSLSTAVASGSYFFTLYKNGTATGLQCSITSSATTCNNATSVSVVAADTLSWQSCAGTHSGSGGTCSAASATAQVNVPRLGATFTATNTGESAVFLATKAGGTPSASAANYQGFGGGANPNATEVNVSTVAPTAGTLDQLYVTMGSAPGVAKTVTFSVFKNGANSGVACLMTGSGGANTVCHDTTHSVSIAENDLISLEMCPGTVISGTCTPAGTPTTDSVRASLRWKPTTAGEMIVMNADATALSTSTTQFAPIGDINPVSNESNELDIVPVAFTLKKLHVANDVAPGGGSPSRTITNRFGTGSGQSSGTITCALTTTSTCSDNTHTYSASLNDFINLQEVPASTPASIVYFKHSWVLYKP